MVKTKRIFKKVSERAAVIMMILGLVFSYGSFLPNETIEEVQADGSATSVTITNSLPIASAAAINGTDTNVTLTENTTTIVTCAATVMDNNGFGDIASVEARLFRTAAGAAGTADDNERYILTGDTECVPSGGADLTETYTCAFSVQFFAIPADNWTCEVTPTDSVGAGTASSDTIILDALNALSVAAGIAYGNMGLGDDSGATPIATLVTNTGNTVMDPQVSSGAVMTCTTGTIAVANQKYAAATFTYSSGGAALSGSPTTLNLALAKPTSTTPVTDNSYWGILIPSTGVEGSCTGSNTFTAVTGS